MKTKAKRVLTSAIVGIVVTLVGLAIAYITEGNLLGQICYWQGYLLTSWVPALNIGTADHPIYEGTPIHVFAFFMGIPLGMVLYSLLAYAVFGWKKGQRDKE
jgi:hypothetical protein